MISFKIKKIRWDSENISVEGDLCINSNPVMPGQVITATKDELRSTPFDKLISENAAMLTVMIPDFVMSVFKNIDTIPCEVSISGTQIKQSAPLPKQTKATLLDKIRQRMSK